MHRTNRLSCEGGGRNPEIVRKSRHPLARTPWIPACAEPAPVETGEDGPMSDETSGFAIVLMRRPPGLLPGLSARSFNSRRNAAFGLFRAGGPTRKPFQAAPWGEGIANGGAASPSSPSVPTVPATGGWPPPSIPSGCCRPGPARTAAPRTAPRWPRMIHPRKS